MTALSTLLGGNRAFGRGYIDGLILANGTDADHDINIAVGECRDSTNTYNMVLGSTLVKQIDAAWAAGTNAGGLDTGSVGNSTWYHVWLIRKDSDGSIDALFSTSATAPTMPAGYTYKRRLGSVLTNGSANILAFMQKGDIFQWKSPILDVSATNPGTAAVLRTLSIPLGVQTRAFFSVSCLDTTGTHGVITYMSDPDMNDDAPSGTAAPLAHTIAVSFGMYLVVYMISNNSSQVRSRVSYSDAKTIFRLATHGWIDPRGKDA